MGRKRFCQLLQCSLSDVGTYTCDVGDVNTSCNLEVYGNILYTLLIKSLQNSSFQVHVKHLSTLTNGTLHWPLVFSYSDRKAETGQHSQPCTAYYCHLEVMAAWLMLFHCWHGYVCTLLLRSNVLNQSSNLPPQCLNWRCYMGWRTCMSRRTRMLCSCVRCPWRTWLGSGTRMDTRYDPLAPSRYAQRVSDTSVNQLIYQTIKLHDCGESFVLHWPTW